MGGCLPGRGRKGAVAAARFVKFDALLARFVTTW